MGEHPLLAALAYQCLWLVPAGLIGGAVAAAVGQPRLVGGLLVGLLLSPSVLGRLAPQVDTRLRHANQAEQIELQTYREQAAQMRLQLVATGVTAEAIDQMDEASAEQVAQLESAAAEVAGWHAAARHWLAMLAAGLFVLGAGAVVQGRRWSTHAVDGVVVAIGPIALVSALAAGAVKLLGASADAGYWQACAGWAAVGLAAALPIHLGRTRRAADGDGDVADVHHAASGVLMIVAWLAAAALMVFAEAPARAAYAVGYAVTAIALGRAAARAITSLTQPGSTRDAMALTLTLVLAAVGAAVIGLHPLAAVAIAALAAGVPTGDDRGHDGHGNPAPARRLVDLALPVFGAVVAAQVELTAVNVWLVLACLVVFGDGKSLGAAATAKLLANRDGGASFAIGARLMVGGGTALVIAWLLTASGVVGQGLLPAAVVGELVLLLAYRPIVGFIDRRSDGAAADGVR